MFLTKWCEHLLSEVFILTTLYLALSRTAIAFCILFTKKQKVLEIVQKWLINKNRSYCFNYFFAGLVEA